MVLAMELPIPKEYFAAEAQAFVAKERGKCSGMVGEEAGGGRARQIVRIIYR